MHELLQLCPLDAQFKTVPTKQDAAQELDVQACNSLYHILNEHDRTVQTYGSTAGTSTLMDIGTLCGAHLNLRKLAGDLAGID
jgi:hypothetical protein